MSDPQVDRIDLFRQEREVQRSARSFVGLLARAVRLVWRASRSGTALSASLGLTAALMAGLQVLVARHALDVLLHQNAIGGSFRRVVLPITALVGIGVVAALAGSVQTQQSRWLGDQVQLYAMNEILEVTAAAELEQFDDPVFFDRLQRVRASAAYRPVMVTRGLIALVGGMVGVITVGAAVVAIHPLLIPVLVVAGVPALWLARLSGRMEFGFTVRQTPRLRERDYLEQLLSTREYAKEVRAFELGLPLSDRWRDRFHEYLTDLRQHLWRVGSVSVGSTVVTALGTGGSLALLLWLVDSHRISLGAAGAAVVALQLLAGRISSVIGSIATLFESGIFLDEMQGFMDEQPPSRERAPALDPFRELRVDHVGYTYPGSSVAALHDVAMQFEQGRVIALVGENGSGKTTLAKILAGLLSPTVGTVWWDDRPLCADDGRAVRQSVAVLFQDFAKYQLSARENVGFGDIDRLHDLDGIVAASHRAGADEFLTGLPDGYETPLSRVYAGGRDLSIGQWQRVALARAYLRDAPFLILDEPSASLDPRAERALFDQIRDAMQGRTVLLITHRLASVRDAHEIYVLAHGTVVEHGTHGSLLAENGLYAELYRLQADAFAADSD